MHCPLRWRCMRLERLRVTAAALALVLALSMVLALEAQQPLRRLLQLERPSQLAVAWAHRKPSLQPSPVRLLLASMHTAAAALALELERALHQQPSVASPEAASASRSGLGLGRATA